MLVMAMIICYARTSTINQVAGLTINQVAGVEAQLKDLAAAGCQEDLPGTGLSVGERRQLNAAIDYVREGDIFLV